MAGWPRLLRSRRLQGLLWTGGSVLSVGSILLYLAQPVWTTGRLAGFWAGIVLLLTALWLRQITAPGMSTSTPRFLPPALTLLALLAALNALTYRYNPELDLTRARLFTLSEPTIQILQSIDQPVEVIGFFKRGDPRLSRARSLLERYCRYTGYLTYEFHDPTQKLALARSFELEGYGLVFVSGKNHYYTATVDEQGLTRAILHVTRARRKTVYFLTGHGERAIHAGDRSGYSTIRQVLEAENYIVRTVSLAKNSLPTDADLLVIAGARHPLPQSEAEQILAWMSTGGRLLVLVDPQDPLPLPELFRAYGLSLPDGFVVEDMNNALVTLGPHGLTPHQIIPMLTRYPPHEITYGLNGQQTFFPYARPVSIASESQSGYQATAILTTSPASWLETDTSLSEPEFTPGADRSGPFSLGVAVEDPATQTRLVVIGDTEFAANQHLTPHVANADLFVRVVNWLAEDDTVSQIPLRVEADPPLTLAPDQQNLVLMVAVLLVPLLVVLTGAGVWWARR